jgi:ornithine cyclodeaminase/alanine dehydrogenase-like protein (mu-crystallin family)
MALLLTEADVKGLLTMPMALTAVEESFRRLATGSAIVHPRQRLHIPGKSYLHYMAAADATGGYMGLKIYSSAKEGLRFIVPLFNVTTGDLAAIIEADFLGQVRTGAASGVATRWMAREDSRIVGIIGTGLQARTQLEAVSLVRKLGDVRVCGRDANRREKFVAEMAAQLRVPVRSAANAEEAVRDADIVITSTTSTNPVVEGRWLKKGTHINAIGANFPQKRELDAETIERCDVIAVDSREQSKLESGDLIQVFGQDDKRWNRVAEMADFVAGKAPGRTNPEQITLFKSNGIAIEDIVVAGQIYELARQRKIGREIPMWEKDARFGEARGV